MNQTNCFIKTGSIFSLLTGVLLAGATGVRGDSIDVENNGSHKQYAITTESVSGVFSYSISGGENSGSSSETMTRLGSNCSRVEHDTGQSFGSGVHTFDGILYVNSPIDTCIVMQFFGSAGPYSFLRVYSSYSWNGTQYSDGCISKGSSPVLAPHIYGTGAHVTGTMDFGAATLTYWINGSQVSQSTLDTSQTYNMKYGNYGGNTQAPNNNSVRWDNATWRTGSGGGFSGNYELKCVASGLSLNVSGGSTANGAAIIQWPYQGANNSLFTFIPTDSGYYQINSVNSGSDVVVQGASTSNGALIIQWTFGSAQNDQWQPQQNSDGTYTFVNRHSGKVLEDPGSNMSQGTQMDQWSSGGGANQKWNLISH
jgi:hypothetical protein